MSNRVWGVVVLFVSAFTLGVCWERWHAPAGLVVLAAALACAAGVGLVLDREGER